MHNQALQNIRSLAVSSIPSISGWEYAVSTNPTSCRSSTRHGTPRWSTLERGSCRIASSRTAVSYEKMKTYRSVNPILLIL